MLKMTITRQSQDSIVLRLDGRLVDECVPELMTACRVGNLPSRRVELDLGGLSFADTAGVETLRVLAERGLRFTNCSPFIVELMKGNRA